MSASQFKAKLIELKVCPEIIEWAESYSTFTDAWQACPRGDWMLHLYSKLFNNMGVMNDQVFFLAKGHCANTVRRLMKDKRSIDAVDITIAYGEGKTTEQQRSIASDNAVVAYLTAITAYAKILDAVNSIKTYTTATITTEAADIIEKQFAQQLNGAAYAAYAVSNVAAYASDAAAIDKELNNQKQTADICRKYLSEKVLEYFNRN